jgi:hypothetical protein
MEERVTLPAAGAITPKKVGLPARFSGRTAGECQSSREDEVSERLSCAIKRIE